MSLELLVFSDNLCGVGEYLLILCKNLVVLPHELLVVSDNLLGVERKKESKAPNK